VAGEPALSARDKGADERLTAADIAAGGLLAASHVHRYELAASLCGGARVLDLCCGTGYGSRLLAREAASVLGVDVAPEAVEAAGAAVEPELAGRVGFEAADALEFLRRCAADRFDAVICFEGIEHVPEPEALIDELARLTTAGTRLVLSLPNSKGFEERNDFHATDFGFEEARALLERLPEPVLLEQRLAEASVIVPAGEAPGALAGRLEPAAEGSEWANHWLAAVNVPAGELRAASVRFSFLAAPQASAYLRVLEEANAELLRMNARLSRSWLGLHDAAAAAVLRRMDDAKAEAEKWRRIADNNDWGRQELEARLRSPGHRTVESVMQAVGSLPGVGAARRLRRKLGP